MPDDPEDAYMELVSKVAQLDDHQLAFSLRLAFESKCAKDSLASVLLDETCFRLTGDALPTVIEGPKP